MISQQQKVAQHLANGIRSGDFRVGSLLPPAETLARQTRCSTHAVRRAFRQLSDRGILHSVRHQGTRVLLEPPLGRVLLRLTTEPHVNQLLQNVVAHALFEAGYDVELQPALIGDSPAIVRQRQLSLKDADERVLVGLSPDAMAPEECPAFRDFAANFASRVFFQIEPSPVIPDSITITSDLLLAASQVAEHLTQLGHRSIAVTAGVAPGDGSMADRRAQSLATCLRLAGAECHPYYYGLHGGIPVGEFARQHGCTAWWAVNDFQAHDYLRLMQLAGLTVPDDISIVGAFDTPWATTGTVPLTTLSLNPRAIGDTIAAAVMECLSEGGPVTTCRHVPPRLIPRQSTARCRPRQ